MQELALELRGAPDDLAAAAWRVVPADVRGVLLYGSRARRDHLSDSDLDLLALVEEPRKSIHAGLVSLSFYSASQLRSGIGPLFGAHLARDSRVLWDPQGILPILESMGCDRPETPDR